MCNIRLRRKISIGAPKPVMNVCSRFYIPLVVSREAAHLARARGKTLAQIKAAKSLLAAARKVPNSVCCHCDDVHDIKINLYLHYHVAIIKAGLRNARNACHKVLELGTGGYAPSSNIVTLNTPDLSPMGVDAAASGARALYGSTCKQQPSAFNDYHVTCALTASSASVVSCLHVLHMRMWALGLG